MNATFNILRRVCEYPARGNADGVKDKILVVTTRQTSGSGIYSGWVLPYGWHRPVAQFQQPVRAGAQDFDTGEGWRVLPVAQAFHARAQHPEQPQFLGRILREN